MEPFSDLSDVATRLSSPKSLAKSDFFLVAGTARLANEPRLRYLLLPERSAAARDPTVGRVG